MMAYTQPVVLEPFVVLVQLCHSAQNAIDWNQESFFFDKIPKKLSLLQRGDSTGSFRKKGKSKTFFLGTKFHEKLIFSAFFSRELVTNLRS